MACIVVVVLVVGRTRPLGRVVVCVTNNRFQCDFQKLPVHEQEISKGSRGIFQIDIQVPNRNGVRLLHAFIVEGPAQRNCRRVGKIARDKYRGIATLNKKPVTARCSRIKFNGLIQHMRLPPQTIPATREYLHGRGRLASVTTADRCPSKTYCKVWTARSLGRVGSRWAPRSRHHRSVSGRGIRSNYDGYN